MGLLHSVQNNLQDSHLAERKSVSHLCALNGISFPFKGFGDRRNVRAVGFECEGEKF